MITKLFRQIGRFVNQEQGNSATEYAVMLSLIVIASMGAILALGNKIAAVFESFNNVG